MEYVTDFVKTQPEKYALGLNLFRSSRKFDWEAWKNAKWLLCFKIVHAFSSVHNSLLNVVHANISPQGSLLNLLVLDQGINVSNEKESFLCSGHGDI